MTGSYSYTPLIWPMLISAIVSAILAAYAWQHRSVRGSKAFAIQEFFIALWALFTAIDMATTTVEGKFLYHRLEGGAAIIGLSAMLFFALERASSGKWANRRFVIIISSLTVVLIALMATNDLHHLMWSRYWFDGFLRVERGPLGSILFVWALIMPGAALYLFLRLLIRSGGNFRWQALMLFLGALLPILTYFMEPLGINPIAPLDPVIIMWVVSSCLYGIAIFRFQMLELVPMGRDRAIERLANGLLVLDEENRIVDFNPAAQKVLGLSRKTTLGKPAEQVLSYYPEFSTLLRQKTAAAAEIIINGTEQPCFYQAQTSPLIHPNGNFLGQLVLLQDLTEQRRTQDQIIEQQRSLAAMQERVHLARELHDNLGQTLAAAHLQASTARVLLARGDAVETDVCLKRLTEMTIVAESDMREYLLGINTAHSSDLPFFSALHQYVSKFSQQYGIHVEIGTSPQLEARGLRPAVELQLLRIIQEALSNIRKHANAKSAQIRFATVDHLVQVTISDDGKGFEPEAVVSKAGGGFGLLSMRERVEDLGGSIEIKSKTGQGTSVIIKVPLDGKQ